MSEQPAAGKRVIVVGAGPGGVTAALALQQAGAEGSVFERASDLGRIQVGGGVHLWNNATRALQQLGLGDAIREAGAVVEQMEWYSWRGQLLGSGPVRDTTKQIGAPAVGLTRPALHGVLAGALAEGTVTLGAECTGFEQDAEGVTARFADGREERADALIGADGLYSAIRSQILGESQPRYSGVIVCQAAVESPERLSPAGVYGMLWGRGTRVGFYPIKDGTFWYTLVGAPAGGFAGDGSVKDALRSRLAGWAPPVQALLDATPESAINKADIVARDPVDRWGDRRVTLLGDAAHAMTPFLGQGACQAIEDGVVLGQCFEQESDVEAALRAYEQRRMERTAAIVLRSWKVGRAGLIENPVACAVRNQVFKRVFNRMIWPGQRELLTAEL